MTARTWEASVARMMRGDTIADGSGYRWIYLPLHPRARRGFVQEHRIVCEAKVGRYLRSDELVHHVNEVKTDNRPENLEVMSQAEHNNHHHATTPDSVIVEMLHRGCLIPEILALGVGAHRICRIRREVGIPRRMVASRWAKAQVAA